MELEKLGQFAEDESVLEQLLEVKKAGKLRLKAYLKEQQGIEVDENSIFDIQIKRLHEYKRQQMNALYVIYKYFDIRGGNIPSTPITVIFGAKAAPAYIIAKPDSSLLTVPLPSIMKKYGNYKKMKKTGLSVGRPYLTFPVELLY